MSDSDEPHRPEPDALGYHVMKRSHWSLEMAMAWIIWRTETRVAQESVEFLRDAAIYLGDHWRALPSPTFSGIETHADLDPGIMSFDQAKAELWAALGSGDLQAGGIEDATGKTIEIKPLQWPNLKTWSAESDRVSSNTDFRSDVFTAIRVPVAKLVKIWPVKKTKRGRPPKYAWPDFEKEAWRFIEFEGGAPDPSVDPEFTQTTIEKHMAEWCKANWGGEPGESTIREHVAKAIKDYLEKKAR